MSPDSDPARANEGPTGLPKGKPLDKPGAGAAEFADPSATSARPKFNYALLLAVGGAALLMMTVLATGAIVVGWKLMRRPIVVVQAPSGGQYAPPVRYVPPGAPVTPSYSAPPGAPVPPVKYAPPTRVAPPVASTPPVAPRPNMPSPVPYGHPGSYGPPGPYGSPYGPPGYPPPGGFPPPGFPPSGPDSFASNEEDAFGSNDPRTGRPGNPGTAAPAIATGNEVIQLVSNSTIEFRDAGEAWYAARPFTAEAWVQWNPAGNPELVWDAPGGCKAFQRFDSSRGTLTVGYSLRGLEREGDVVPKIQEWHHWAVVSEGEKFTVFLDGERALGGNVPRPRNPKMPAEMGAPPLRLKAQGKVPSGMIANVRDVRISNTARYIANFTPPDDLGVDADTFARPSLAGSSRGKLRDQVDENRPARLLENAKVINYVSKGVTTTGGQTAATRPAGGPPTTAMGRGIGGVGNGAPTAASAIDLNVEVGPAVNLLADVGVTFPSGDAKIVDSQLTTAGKGAAKVEFEYEPPAQYLVDCAVTRTRGSHGFALQLVVAGKPCAVLIDDFSTAAYYSGLERIRGSRVSSKFSPARVAGEQLDNGKVSRLRCFVVKNHVVVELDGKVLVNWRGDAATLDRDGSLAIPSAGRLGICTMDASYAVDSLRVYPILKHRFDDSSAVASATRSNSPLRGSPATMSASNLQIQVSGWVDLLNDVEVVKHGGNYFKTGNDLFISAKDTPRLEFAYDLPPEYVIDAQLLRLEGQHPLLLRFPVSDRPVMLNMDGFASSGFRTGLEIVAGQSALHTPFASSGQRLPLGGMPLVKVVVLKNRVLLLVDGQTVLDWTGDPATLEIPKEFQFGAPKTSLALGTDSAFKVDHLHLWPITGTSLESGATPTQMRVENLDLKIGLPVHMLREGKPKQQVGGVGWAGNILSTSEANECSLEFGYPLPEEYIIQGQIVRKSGTDLAAVNVVVDGHACTFVMDGFASGGGPFSGLETIDGKRANDNSTSVKGRLLTIDKPVELLIAVVKNRVIAAVDGRTLVDWRGDANRLGSHLRVGRSKNLGITTCDSRVEFRGLRMAPISKSSIATNLASSSPAGGAASGDASDAGSRRVKEKMQDEAAQAEARTKLKEALGESIAKATKPDEKYKLAKEFVEVAGSENVATRYVLLLAARKMAVAGQEFEYALTLVDQVARDYEVDALALKLQTLQEAAAMAGLSTVTQERLADAAHLVTTDAEENDRLDVVEPASKIALDAVNKTKNPDKRKAFKAIRDRVVAEQQLRDKAQAAIVALQSSPDDPANNLIVGMFYSQRDDWPKALPHLAKGSNKDWAAAATLELAAKDAESRLAAGDAWFALIDAAAAAEKDAVQSHTLELLEAAAPELVGLNKAKADKRIEELKETIAAADSADPEKVAARSKKRVNSRASLQPGLMARVMVGSRTPTFAMGIAQSSDDFDAALGPLQTALNAFNSSGYFTIVAVGYIQLDQDEAVTFDVENCVCHINDVKVVDTHGNSRSTVELKLKRGRHPIKIARSVYGPPGPRFHITTVTSRRNPLLHSRLDLQTEMTKSFSVNGRTSTGQLLFGGGQ